MIAGHFCSPSPGNRAVSPHRNPHFLKGIPMRVKQLTLSASVLFMLFGVVALSSYPLLAGDKANVLHSFNRNGNGGDSPVAGLILDNAGNLYGTTRVSNGTG